MIENIELIVKEISKQKNFKSQNIKPEKPDFLTPGKVVCTFEGDNKHKQAVWISPSYFYLGLIPSDKISLDEAQLQEISETAYSAISIRPLGRASANFFSHFSTPVSEDSKLGGFAITDILPGEKDCSILTLFQIMENGNLWGVDGYSSGYFKDSSNPYRSIRGFEEKLVIALGHYLIFMKYFLKISSEIVLHAGFLGARNCRLYPAADSFEIHDDEILAKPYPMLSLSNIKFPYLSDSKANGELYQSSLDGVYKIYEAFLKPFFIKVYKAIKSERPHQNEHHIKKVIQEFWSINGIGESIIKKQ